MSNIGGTSVVIIQGRPGNALTSILNNNNLNEAPSILFNFNPNQSDNNITQNPHQCCTSPNNPNNPYNPNNINNKIKQILLNIVRQLIKLIQNNMCDKNSSHNKHHRHHHHHQNLQQAKEQAWEEGYEQALRDNCNSCPESLGTNSNDATGGNAICLICL